MRSGTEEAHQGLEDQAKMAAVLKGAQEADAVELAGGVQPTQLVQDALLSLAGSEHGVICANHLDGHLLEVAVIQALGLVPGAQHRGEDSLAMAGKHLIPPIHHLPNLQHREQNVHCSSNSFALKLHRGIGDNVDRQAHIVHHLQQDFM